MASASSAMLSLQVLKHLQVMHGIVSNATDIKVAAVSSRMKGNMSLMRNHARGGLRMAQSAANLYSSEQIRHGGCLALSTTAYQRIQIDGQHKTSYLLSSSQLGWIKCRQLARASDRASPGASHYFALV